MSTREEIVSFDPVEFSLEENVWLLENIDKPAVVALRNVPPGVNPRAVEPLLARLEQLEQLRKHEGQQWIGFDALRERIKIYLNMDAKWATDAKRSRRAPRFPSLYSYDSRGRGHLGGPGSDSGRVRTYFDEKGNRQKFEVDLIPDHLDPWQAPGFTEAPTDKRLTVDGEKNRIECFCGHVEAFKPDSRSSYSAARARMSKHLRGAKDHIDDHRELHLAEFGG